VTSIAGRKVEEMITSIGQSACCPNSPKLAMVTESIQWSLGFTSRLYPSFDIAKKTFEKGKKDFKRCQQGLKSISVKNKTCWRVMQPNVLN